MRLSRLVRSVTAPDATGARDLEIGDIAYDSRRVQPGTLFVAVPSVGGAADSGGYRYIDQAISRGAAAVVTQVPRERAGVPVVIVPDARAALADLAGEFFCHPSEQLGVFAVTGTDGKTTTTYFLEQILRHAGFSTGLVGTVEIKVGERRIFNADRMTTPESLDLQRLLRTMANEGVTHVALEASSHALALKRLRGTTLAACAVTNVTADHIAFHGSLDAYFEAKASLFSEVGKGRPAVLNADDASFDRLAALLPGPIISYGLAPETRVRAAEIVAARWSTDFTLVVDGSAHAAAIPLPGRYNVSNALAAAGLALAAGLTPEAIARGLSQAEPPPGRLQRVSTDQGLDILVDYAHTPHAFRSVLAEVRGHVEAGGRVIAVFGAAGGRDRDKRPRFAQIAREYVDYFFITNEDPCGESPDAIMAEVAAGAPRHEEGVRFEKEPDRGRAIEKAIRRARAGDVVVILGKGHERSIVANGHQETWNDVQAVQAILERMR
jgi:UDP-N-acetylmuramoyl-L-alanyl-D-glutamate--2,6-diaminopimelate ligase